MRTVLVLVTLLVVTPINVLRVLIASLAGVRDREGGVYRRSLRNWGAATCWAAGARLHAHGLERLRDGRSRVLVANHVSWFDVFALAAVLPHVAFVSKAELRRIPLFGRAMSAAGHLFVDRKNRKAAFATYEDAALRIRSGTTVVIFPEGTRGYDYPLRPFKKGPFVLAVAAGTVVTPVLLHGTLEVMRKGSARVRNGDIHVHILDDISTDGCTYEDRDELADRARDAMSAAQEKLYGVRSQKAEIKNQKSAISNQQSVV